MKITLLLYSRKKRFSDVGTRNARLRIAHWAIPTYGRQIFSITSIITLFILFSFSATAAASLTLPKMTITATSWNNGTGADYNPPENVLDWDMEGSMWHSDWQDGDEQWKFPQVLIIEFDREVEIDAIGYLPRQSGSNGEVLEYEFWTSTSKISLRKDFYNTNNWTKLDSGYWDYWGDVSKYDYQILEFKPVKTKYVKFVILDGEGGWASCSNLVFNFTGIENPSVWSFHENLSGNRKVSGTSGDALDALGQDSFGVKSSSIKYVALGIILLLMIDAAVFFVIGANRKTE